MANLRFVHAIGARPYGTHRYDVYGPKESVQKLGRLPRRNVCASGGAFVLPIAASVSSGVVLMQQGIAAGD
jgi:hypothetical protein